MIVQALKQFPLPILTCVALLLFFTVFMGVVVRTYIFTSKNDAQKLADIVLDKSELERGTT